MLVPQGNSILYPALQRGPSQVDTYIPAYAEYRSEHRAINSKRIGWIGPLEAHERLDF